MNTSSFRVWSVIHLQSFVTIIPAAEKALLDSTRKEGWSEVHRTPIFIAFSAIINFDTVSCEHFSLFLCPFYIRFILIFNPVIPGLRLVNPGISGLENGPGSMDFGIPGLNL